MGSGGNCARCTCKDGVHGCVSACPPSVVSCGPPQVERLRKEKLNDHCFCERPYCADKDDKGKYNAAIYWLSL